MNKRTRLIKRLVALFLVLLLSIESFAALVSDNDGSAFITKAEFDSLKNNFQSLIDQYNTSIDNKIDGAIASYLAGTNIKKQEELVNYYADFIKQNCVDYRDIKWSSTETRSCESSDMIELYKDLTSAVLGSNNKSKITVTDVNNYLYSINVYLFGDYSASGSTLTVPERFVNGFDGWLTSRWILSGTVIGNTINSGYSVSAERNLGGFFNNYINRGMGTQLFYHHQSVNISDDWQWGAVFGNGLVASIEKTYFDKATSAYSRNKPNTKEYVFAPWAATTFSYEDFTDSAYTWVSPIAQNWLFRASSDRVHALVDNLPSSRLNQDISFTIKAIDVKKMKLKTFTLNNLTIMDWVQKYGWAGDIKAGVPLTVAPADGLLEIEYKASSNGWLVAFNPISASDYTWGGARLNASDNSSFKIDKYAVSTTSNKIKIENMKKGLICFMFVPNSSTDQFINVTKVGFYRD